MIIITGAIGTGKSFVAKAMADANPGHCEVIEVSSKEEAFNRHRAALNNGKDLIFVCNGIVLSPAELCCSSVPAYLIHITKTR